MKKSLLDTLYDYVNGTLRDDLRFREYYSYPIYLPEDYTIFFGKVNSDQREDLKNILISHPDSVVQVKQIFKEFIESNINDVDKINLIFDNNGFGIKFSRGEPTNMNIDSYANIISELSTIEEINEFCRSNKEFNKACKNKELWRVLVKMEYPFEYKGEYNYERLYKGIKFYKSHEIDPVSGYPYVKNAADFELMNELLKFLFNEVGVNPEDYEMFVAFATQVGDKGIIDKIIDYYKSIDNIDTLADQVLDYLHRDTFNNNIKGVTNFFKLILPKMKDGISAGDIVETLAPREKFPFSKEMYKTIMNNYEFADSRMLGKFIRRTATNAIFKQNFDLLTEILMTGKFLDWVASAVDNYISIEQNLPPEDIISLIKSYMSDKEVEDFNNSTREALDMAKTAKF